MAPETCEEHVKLASNIAVMKNDIAYIRNKVCKHVEEGERPGGFRDRMLILEREVSDLKKRFWLSAGLGGIIGAIIGSGSRDIIIMFLRWIMGK